MKLIACLSIVITVLLIQFIDSLKINANNVFIVLGQAHFFMAYWYKIKRQNPSTTKYLMLIISGFFIFVSYYFLKYEHLLIILTSIYFVIHFSLDVFHLTNYKATIVTFIKTATPLFIVYLSFLKLGNFSELLFIYGFPLSFLLFFTLHKSEKWYFFFFTGFATFLYTFSLLERFNIYLGSALFHQYFMPIIIAHYLIWYLYYFDKLKKQEFLKKYVVDVLLFNGIIGLAFFFYFYNKESVFKYFFRLDYFLIWTWLHYIWTLRKSDFQLLK
ncbi:MAG TPA: hypothetical protein PKN22_05845 [Taishania sp.]|nr:hypothetical protein [Taishania sp.]